MTSILHVSCKHACFTGRCTAHSKVKQPTVGHTANEEQGGDKDPGGLAPELMFLFRKREWYPASSSDVGPRETPAGLWALSWGGDPEGRNI